MGVSAGRLLALTAVTLCLATACSSTPRATHYPTYTPLPTYTPAPTYTPYPPPRVTLHIADDFFQESEIAVVKGTVVMWVNDGENEHTVTSAAGAVERWDTGELKPGQRGSHAFSRAGLFAYFCQVHEYMTASIRVVE